MPDDRAERPVDHLNRQFQAIRPSERWVADFTYVATGVGFVDVAFVVDVFARRIIGGRNSRSMKADLVLDALEQALWVRSGADGVIHPSDAGSQYLSIRDTERLAEAGAVPSVGSVGDSYDNGASSEGAHVQRGTDPPGEKSGPCSLSGGGAGNLTVEAH